MATTLAPFHRVKTSLPPGASNAPPHPLATFLGLFSIGLGLAEMAAPDQLARLIGFRYGRGVLRTYGAREVAAGVGILTRERPAGWLWARVVGDVLDLATLGANLSRAEGEDRRRAVAAIAAVAGVTVLDLICAQDLS